MKDVTMDERRKLERFNLHVSAKVAAEGPESKEEVLELETRDISADGAFFISHEPIAKGARVDLEMVLSMDKLQEVIGKKGKVELKIKGSVVRSDADGIAVSFDKKYYIRALDNVNNE